MFTSVSPLDCWLWDLVDMGNVAYGKLWKRATKKKGRNIMYRQVCEKFGFE